MKKRILLVLALALTLLMGGTTTSPFQRGDIQRELGALTKRGFTYRMLDNDMIELTDPLSGEKHIKSLRKPSEATIRAWAAQRGIPILEIDPSLVDTIAYAGWYTHFTVVPLSNGFGVPLVLADLDGNKKAECYGAYDDPFSSVETRCYEIDTNGTVTLKHDYFPLQGASRCILNANGDSLTEVLFTFGGPTLDFEQPERDSLPTVFRFEHNRYETDDPGFTGLYVGSLDGDSLTDFLYKGSEQYSTGGVSKVYVTEYSHQAHNFVRMWSTDYGLGGVASIGGFAVDDFDGDGSMEFVVSESSYGRVFVTENIGDNLYATIWQDSTPFINLYHTVSGDVDGDAKPEFFVGGDLSNGNWTIMYEADSNNHYSARFMFHIVPDGFFSPTYLTTDVDGDGHPELVIMSSGYLHVFKASGNDQYRLWYFRHDNNTHSVQFYDVNGDGRKDILISKGVNEIGFFTDVYKATSIVSVTEEPAEPDHIILGQNYPNPFNPTTTISYELPADSKVTLKVFDVLGREVATLVDEFKPAGHHQTSFIASQLASGVYLLRLQSGSFTTTRKLLLLK